MTETSKENEMRKKKTPNEAMAGFVEAMNKFAAAYAKVAEDFARRIREGETR